MTLPIKWENLRSFKQLGYKFEDYLLKREWKNIAIYGIGKDAIVLYNEINTYEKVKIKYLIDKRGCSNYIDKKIYKPNEINYADVDIIIITVDFINVMHDLKELIKNKCEVICLEVLLWEIEAVDSYEAVLQHIKKNGSKLFMFDLTMPLLKINNPSIYEKRAKYDMDSMVSNVPAYMKDLFIDNELISDTYVHDICNLKYPITRKGNYDVLADVKSTYYNVINHQRITCYNPEIYDATIYVFGPCYAVGYLAEDKYTVQSQLQSLINDNPFNEIKYRVVNCGCFGGGFTQFMRLLDTDIQPNDIVAILGVRLQGYQYICEISDMPVFFYDIKFLFDRPHPYGEIFIDCNHILNKGYRIIANGMYGLLKSQLKEDIISNKEGRKDLIKCNQSTTNLNKGEMKVFDNYLESLKSFKSKGSVAGSIVMNGNPFTLGHQYLVETASKTVEFLYVFVVEEDKSEIPFDYRLEMAQRGTAHLENVEVLPSSKYILSTETFPEYFEKDIKKDIVIDASNDINIFCKQVAPILNIKKRFVGDEPFCEITKQYNLAMKEILPQYGMELVIVPRLEYHNRAISATKIRELLREKRISEIKALVPNTTFDILYEKGLITID